MQALALGPTSVSFNDRRNGLVKELEEWDMLEEERSLDLEELRGKKRCSEKIMGD